MTNFLGKQNKATASSNLRNGRGSGAYWGRNFLSEGVSARVRVMLTNVWVRWSKGVCQPMVIIPILHLGRSSLQSLTSLTSVRRCEPLSTVNNDYFILIDHYCYPLVDWPSNGKVTISSWFPSISLKHGVCPLPCWITKGATIITHWTLPLWIICNTTGSLYPEPCRGHGSRKCATVATVGKRRTARGADDSCDCWRRWTEWFVKKDGILGWINHGWSQLTIH